MDERVHVATGTLRLVEERTSGVPSVAVMLLWVSTVAPLAAPLAFGLLWLLASLMPAAVVGGTLLAVAAAGRFVGDKFLLRWSRSLLQDDGSQRVPDGPDVR